MLFVKIILSQISIALVFAQVKRPAPCLEFQPVDNFDVKRFAGYWIAFAKTADENDLENTKCISYNFGEVKNGQWNASYLYFNTTDDSSYEKQNLIPMSEPGKFKRNWDNRQFVVLGTDYDHWTTIYGCLENDDSRLDTIHIITRSNRPIANSTEIDAIGEALGNLKAHNILYDEIETPDIRDCDQIDWSKAKVVEEN